MKTKLLFFTFALLVALLVTPMSSHALFEEGAPSLVGAPDSSFVALTSIPGIQEAADSGDIAGLLNTLYMLCIGAAAIIAVIQIIRGGIVYMMGDSFTEKKEAKHHIGMAILGLVLVLSPYLVFSVIDPRILNLNVDVGELKPTDRANPSTETSNPGAASCVNDATKQALQSSYNTRRQAQPTGAISLPVTDAAAASCCSAITTANGDQACTTTTTTRGDTGVVEYSCRCNASTIIGGESSTSVYVPSRLYVAFQPTPETEFRFYLDANETRVFFQYETQAACTADRTALAPLVQSIKSSAFSCDSRQAPDLRDRCNEYLPKIKSGEIVPTATSLSTISQTCAEVRR